MKRAELKKRIEAEMEACLRSEFNASSLKALKFLSVAYQCVATGTDRNKRSVYYEGVEIFGKQCAVDRLLKLYARRLGCAQDDLGIKPSLKGLVSGSIVFYASSGLGDDGGTKKELSGKYLIPDMSAVERIEHAVQLVLVVEKDSVFSMTVHPSIITVCGKGYPCRNTLALLVHLALSATIFCLTDFDPHGLHIFLTYRKAVPSIRRIGLSAADLFEYRIDESECIVLSAHDYKMIKRIRSALAEEGYIKGAIAENTSLSNSASAIMLDDLAFMEGLGRKLELDSLLKLADFEITDFITRRRDQ
ncbi:meiotic recombination protein SPO11 [Pancytospora philotis]|nr:meiotic recombination protein SPO11 [Pancytospora philotis]